MSITHKIILIDEGMGSERVAVRSVVKAPPHATGYECQILTHQSEIPPDMSDHLKELIRYHEHTLAREVGEKWIQGEK